MAPHEYAAFYQAPDGVHANPIRDELRARHDPVVPDDDLGQLSRQVWHAVLLDICIGWGHRPNLPGTYAPTVANPTRPANA
ncbi:MAG TPA: hypothetical protein VFD53_09055 [Ilumatobacter sp.]|jgi:hypothetical protein|nr:hypothetical protein [Ilumatobacter sp.]